MIPDSFTINIERDPADERRHQIVCEACRNGGRKIDEMLQEFLRDTNETFQQRGESAPPR